MMAFGISIAENSRKGVVRQRKKDLKREQTPLPWISFQALDLELGGSLRLLPTPAILGFVWIHIIRCRFRREVSKFFPGKLWMKKLWKKGGARWGLRSVHMEQGTG